MDTTQMVTTWITENAIGKLAQYDIPNIVAMIQTWADEDCAGIASALPADDVASIVESYRGALR